MKQSTFHILIISLSFLLVFITFLLTILASNGIFNNSLYIQHYLQTQCYSKFWKGYFNFFDLLINPGLAVPILAIVYCFVKDKLFLLQYSIYLSVITLISVQLKQFYAQQRPFWMYETNPLYNVENFDIICNTDFGMPSGHAFLSISICEFILVDYVLPVVKSQYLRIFCILFIALVVISVDFGRIYLGAHSDLQVVFGLCLGFFFVLLYRIYCKELIAQTVESVSSSGKSTKHLRMIVSGLLSMFLLPIISFYIEQAILNQQEEQEVWAKEIEKKCETTVTKLDSFQYAGLSSSSVGFIAPFLFLIFYYGKLNFFLERRFLQRRHTIFIGFVILISCLLLFFIVMIIPILQSAILNYLKFIVGFSSSVAGLTLVGPWIVLKFKWIEEEQSAGIIQEYLEEQEAKT